MKHARVDYNRIQDPANLIPDDEPVFLIRGQDPAGAVAVLAWADAAEKLGAGPEMLWRARSHADTMARYAKEHGKEVPDL